MVFTALLQATAIAASAARATKQTQHALKSRPDENTRDGYKTINRRYTSGFEYVANFDELKILCERLKQAPTQLDTFPDVLIFQNDPCTFLCKGIAMVRSDHNQEVDGVMNMVLRLDPTDLLLKDTRYEGLPNSKVARSILSLYRIQSDNDIVETDYSDLDLILIRI